VLAKKDTNELMLEPRRMVHARNVMARVHPIQIVLMGQDGVNLLHTMQVSRRSCLTKGQVGVRVLLNAISVKAIVTVITTVKLVFYVWLVGKKKKPFLDV
jgi:hypothetical protein